MIGDYLSYYSVIAAGVAISAGVILKIFYGFDISSDWFWFLAGIGLAVEGLLSWRKKKKFDKKYKTVMREGIN